MAAKLQQEQDALGDYVIIRKGVFNNDWHGSIPGGTSHYSFDPKVPDNYKPLTMFVYRADNNNNAPGGRTTSFVADAGNLTNEGFDLVVNPGQNGQTVLDYLVLDYRAIFIKK